MKSENKLKVTITPTEEWPTQGTIEFKNVRMKYDENLPFVLNDISFSINDAEKIGILFNQMYILFLIQKFLSINFFFF